MQEYTVHYEIDGTEFDFDVTGEHTDEDIVEMIRGDIEDLADTNGEGWQFSLADTFTWWISDKQTIKVARVLQ